MKYILSLKEDGLYDDTLYVVKLDVTDAFGSIKHEILLEIINKFVVENPKITFGEFSALTIFGKMSKKKRFIMLDADGNIPTNYKD